MAFVPFSNVGQFNVRATFQTNQIENVLHFANDVETITPSILVAGATVLLNSWASNMVDLLHEDYLFREVYAVDLTTSTSETATALLTPPQAGLVGGAAAPGNAALVITHRTTLRGRSFRGRTYIGGLAGTNIDGNIIDSTAANDILEAFNAVVDDMLAEGWSFVVCSRISGGVERTTGISTVVATSLLRDFNIDSQRRRLNGRGA